MEWEDIDLLLEENSFLRYELFNERNTKSKTIEQRDFLGEFATLYETLRQSETDFFDYIRMSTKCFDYILNGIESSIIKRNSTFSPAHKLIICLRFLATGISYRGLKHSFRVHQSTIANIVYETCAAIWTQFVNVHMPRPTSRHLKNIANDYFELWKFPHCIGAIDGKHCEIICPAKTGSRYYNYLNYFSVILQAVADVKKRFVAIEVGGRGRQSDGGTFHYSVLNHMMENHLIDIPPPELLPATRFTLPYVLIGDEAYPLKQNLLRPFPSRVLNDEKTNFNNRLSRARKCVECAFGILHAKWRILAKPIETNVDHAILIIKTVCLLHNIICDIDGNSDYDYNTINSFDRNLVLHRNQNIANISATNIRDMFVRYFWETRN